MKRRTPKRSQRPKIMSKGEVKPLTPAPPCPPKQGEAKGDCPAAPCSDESPWPLCEVLDKLCEAADILLSEKNYDGHGWELIAAARLEAIEFLTQNAKGHASP